MINWQPIDTAPKDNKRPLFLAHFNEAGELTEMDFNASWEREQESWEIPQVYCIWVSEHGRVEEPTHWAYMDADPLPAGSPCTCPSGDGSLRWPCPQHPSTKLQECTVCNGDCAGANPQPINCPFARKAADPSESTTLGAKENSDDELTHFVDGLGWVVRCRQAAEYVSALHKGLEETGGAA